jgi:4-hydroxyproline epimerase
MRSLDVIDSHTGGEPTRVILAGGPSLSGQSMAERVDLLRTHHDTLRQSVILEPRGSEVLVGAWLCEPHAPHCTTGVIFFNNVGYLGMCGHGMIGVVATLHHLGRLSPGTHRFDTPVGVVEAELHDNGEVGLTNVPSRRTVRGLQLDVPGIGPVTGDVAWGGNWFFLVEHPIVDIALDRVESLTQLAWAIRQEVNAAGHPEVDHVELFAPGRRGGNARNFVLCPGKAYDRSPCGTGTSAKLACLAADHRLAEHTEWIQESIVGSTFRARYRWLDRDRGEILPHLIGRAHITAETRLIFAEDDPFHCGISIDLSTSNHDHP